MKKNKTNYTDYSLPSEEIAEAKVEGTEVQEVEAPKPVKAEAKAPEKTGVVTGCVKLNVREKPSTSAQIVAVLVAGTMVTITSSEVGWYRIKSGKVTGYVMANYIKIS